MSDTTIRSVYFASKLARAVCDSLNLESGRIYRKKGIWLSGGTQERYNDFLNADSPKLLHAHSIDAAQQGFAKACKTAKANRGEGANYPHKRKHFRATVWKGRNGTQDGKILTSIRRAGDGLLLPMARGQKALELKLPEPLRTLPVEAFSEVRRVYNKSSRPQTRTPLQSILVKSIPSLSRTGWRRA